jgi:hypothetical protein
MRLPQIPFRRESATALIHTGLHAAISYLDSCATTMRLRRNLDTGVIRRLQMQNPVPRGDVIAERRFTLKSHKMP